mgnify:CR=1 FL=1
MKIGDRIKKAVLYPALLCSAIAFPSCQSAQVNYMKNPAKATGWEIEAGRTQNSLDASLPRTYSESAAKFTDNGKRIPADFAEIIDRAFAIMGTMPFRGRYFGKDLYEPGIFDEKNRDAANYKPLEKFNKETGRYAQYVAVHILDSVFNLMGSVGRLSGHLIGGVSQGVNMGMVLPMTANTNERAKIFSDETQYDKENDSLKYGLDATSDVLKAPIRTLLWALAGTESNPDTWRYLWMYVKKWGGVEVERAKMRKLDYKFDDGRGNTDSERIVANAIPIIHPLLDWQWNTTHRQKKTGKKGELELVADTYDYYEKRMLVNLASDDAWYLDKQAADYAPGVITGKNYYAAKSGTLRTISTITNAAFKFVPGGSALKSEGTVAE